MPLVEIVTRPIEGAGARAPEVAAAYVRTLRDIFRALEVSEARMERGNVRADVNVSLRPSPDAPLGTRTETKNVNSFKAIEKTVTFEIRRQAKILTEGGKVIQETRHWHEDTATTSSGREKSDAEDYRYFPEPDLVPVAPAKEWVDQLRANLPELPVARRRRLREEYGFSDMEMRDVVNADALDIIEATVEAGAVPQAARKWWMGEISRIAKEKNLGLEQVAAKPADVAQLQDLVDQGKLNDKLARKVIAGVLEGEGTPAEVMQARGLEIVRDTAALEAAVAQVIADNPKVVEQIKGGKVKAIGALMGGVMRATKGQADAGETREMILKQING